MDGRFVITAKHRVTGETVFTEEAVGQNVQIEAHLKVAREMALRESLRGIEPGLLEWRIETFPS